MVMALLAWGQPLSDPFGFESYRGVFFSFVLCLCVSVTFLIFKKKKKTKNKKISQQQKNDEKTHHDRNQRNVTARVKMEREKLMGSGMRRNGSKFPSKKFQHFYKTRFLFAIFSQLGNFLLSLLPSDFPGKYTIVSLSSITSVYRFTGSCKYV